MNTMLITSLAAAGALLGAAGTQAAPAVVATDPGSVCDMAAFAEQTGNALLEQGSENSKFVFYLKKA